jgi:hypothetical protein
MIHPRRVELSRRHSREMGALFYEFVMSHDVKSEFLMGELTEEDEAAWDTYSAELFARHEAERRALAAELEAEQRQRGDQEGNAERAPGRPAPPEPRDGRAGDIEQG